jgi:hypothetical protein
LVVVLSVLGFVVLGVTPKISKGLCF